MRATYQIFTILSLESQGWYMPPPPLRQSYTNLASRWRELDWVVSFWNRITEPRNHVFHQVTKWAAVENIARISPLWMSRNGAFSTLVEGLRSGKSVTILSMDTTFCITQIIVTQNICCNLSGTCYPPQCPSKEKVGMSSSLTDIEGITKPIRKHLFFG